MLRKTHWKPLRTEVLRGFIPTGTRTPSRLQNPWPLCDFTTFSFRCTQAARSLGRLPRWGWETLRGPGAFPARRGALDSTAAAGWSAGERPSGLRRAVPGASASAAPALRSTPLRAGPRGRARARPKHRWALEGSGAPTWGPPGLRGRGRRGRQRGDAGPPPPLRHWARRPREPQVVPRAGPFLLPLSFLSPPLPLARCRRHFPRFLLPLQSGGREGAAGSFLPLCKLERDSRLHSPLRPPRPAPGSCSSNFLSPRGPGTPAVGGRRWAPGSRGSDPPEPFPAAARAPLPRRPPARPSVRPSCPPRLLPAAGATRLPRGAPPLPGLSFVLDAHSRSTPTRGGLRAALAPGGPPRREPASPSLRPPPCPSTRGPWSPRGCAGPRRPGPRARRSSAHWSRSARTPWSACWRSSPTCRAARGTSSASSRARRPRWAAAPPRCTAASTPCTPPPRASTTAE